MQSNALKLLRISKNLSRLEVAEILNLSESGYAKLERGETKLDLERAKQIAGFYNVPIDELLNDFTSNINDYSKDRTGDNNLIKENYQNNFNNGECLSVLTEIRDLIKEMIKK